MSCVLNLIATFLLFQITVIQLLIVFLDFSINVVVRIQPALVNGQPYIHVCNFKCLYHLYRGPGGSVSWVVGSSNSYKLITNTAWIRVRLCKLQKRVHLTRNCK